MKKVMSIVAVVLFAAGMFAMQVDAVDFDFSIENIIACGDCDSPPPGDRGNGNA